MSEVDLWGNAILPTPQSILHGRFGVPPFSIIDARAGDWQSRKRLWLSTGIESEVGRGKGLTYNVSNFDHYRIQESGGDPESDGIIRGTSVFDPALCETVYKWFCPTGGRVLDPFAGGSVRGVVADAMGLRYTGIELRQEQVDANRRQAEEMGVAPTWICADSEQWLLTSTGQFDFVFSCPPYGDLEVYSDHPADLSTMGEHDFDRAYSEIIRGCVRSMRPDSFAVFVVGNYRNGHRLIDLAGKTTKAF